MNAADVRVQELGRDVDEVVFAARAFSNAFPAASWSRLDPPTQFATAGHVAVLPNGGLPVGVGGVLNIYEQQATIALAVAREARGRGIGRALFDAIESSVPTEVSQLTVLRSDTTDPRTAPFLRARGFQQEKEAAWTWVTDLSTPGPGLRQQDYRLDVIESTEPTVAR